MTALKDAYTSTGAKLFFHQEAMANLRNGKGQCVTTHVMATDRCAHRCAFCSVQSRAGDAMPLADIEAYLDILLRFSLKSCILSGGGNPILYKCPQTGKNFNDLVDAIHGRGLEIGLITDGMPMVQHPTERENTISGSWMLTRRSWKTVLPQTLDKLTWIRISMAGLDHAENEVYVPDVDRSKTTLGLSYVGHDIFYDEAEPHHGKVSTPADLITLDPSKRKPAWMFKDRIPVLTEQIRHYVETYKPSYVRMTPNCLEPAQIPERCELLQGMADAIDPNVLFVQFKPPQAPKHCYLGYPHPVLNCDGYVYPCDAVVLSVAEVGYRTGHPEHRFDSPWRMCHWKDIASIYEQPVRSLIADPGEICRGCVFWKTNAILEGVVDGTADITPPSETPTHANFV